VKTFILGTLAAVLLAGCSGDLGGTFAIGTSRVADTQVVLVAATPAFEEAWKKAADDYRAAMIPLDEAVKKEQEKADAASAFADSASQSMLDAYRSSAEETDFGSRMASMDARRGAMRYSNQASTAASEAASAVHDSKIARKRAREPHAQHAEALIKWGKVAETRTNASGNYVFQRVKRGRYYVTAYRGELDGLVALHSYWFVPVEVKGDTTLDLAMSNIGGSVLFDDLLQDAKNHALEDAARRMLR